MDTDKPVLTEEDHKAIRKAVRKAVMDKALHIAETPRERTEEDDRRAQEAYERIVKTRVKLLLDHPFFGAIATHLEIKEADFNCTMATDGDHQFYNTDFVLESDEDFLSFGVANNVSHLIFDHLGRRGNRNVQAWNIATDIIVNDMLKKQGFKLPENVIYDSRFDSDSQTSEEVYEIILPEVEAGKVYYNKNGESVLVESLRWNTKLDDNGETILDFDPKDTPAELNDEAKQRVERSNSAVQRARDDSHLRKFAPKIKG